MLLALDTATHQAGVALFDGDQVAAMALWQGGRRHGQWLAPTVARLLEQIGAAISDIGSLAVAIGPGSFTGLRVGLSFAKGIAAARSLPLVGVSTLDATAYPHVGQGRALVALVQAGRGRYAWSLYPTSATPSALDGSPPALATRDEIIAALNSTPSAPLLLVGDLSSADRTHVAEALGPRVTLPPPVLAMRTPAAIAALGWQRLAAGRDDEAATLEPIYLRRPTSGTSDE